MEAYLGGCKYQLETSFMRVAPSNETDSKSTGFASVWEKERSMSTNVTGVPSRAGLDAKSDRVP
jgi:hypothetical protein